MLRRGRNRSLPTQAPVRALPAWQPYRWPPFTTGIARPPPPADARMSFFFVPLILAGLSTLPGAPAEGYLRRDDVVAWRLLLRDVFDSSEFEGRYRDWRQLPAGVVLQQLSFDNLAHAVGQVVLSLYGPSGSERQAQSSGSVQDIHNQVVDRASGYVAPDIQEAVVYVNNAALQHQLLMAGCPEVVAYQLYMTGYGIRRVPVADGTGPALAGSIGIRWQQCQCQQCTGVMQLSVFLSCDACGSVCCYGCTGLSTVPVDRWECRQCRRVAAYPMRGHDSYLHEHSASCRLCTHPVDDALCWRVGGGHTHADEAAETVCAMCCVDRLCASRGQCWVCDEAVDCLHVRSTTDIALTIDLSTIDWDAVDLVEVDDIDWGRFRLMAANERAAGLADDVRQEEAGSQRMFDDPEPDDIMYDDEVLDGADMEDDDNGQNADVDDSLPAPTVSDQAPDTAVWAAIEQYAGSPGWDEEVMRTLIARLRRRPRNPQLSRLHVTDVQPLRRLHELWYGAAAPTAARDMHAAFARLLRAIYHRHITRWQHLAQGTPMRSRVDTYNIARSNSALLRPTAFTVEPSFVGVLRTDDLETDAQHEGMEYFQCAACDAGLFGWEVINHNGRTYGRYCCFNGQVSLRPLRCGDDPAVGALMREAYLTRPQRLSTSSLVRRHGRCLNSSLAISCQAVQCRPMLTRGMQSYVVNTRIAHYLGSLVPEDGNRPQFAQMYVYDAMYNAAVGEDPEDGSTQNAHRDALQSYFARSRTTRVGRETQTALLQLVDRFRAVLHRVCEALRLYVYLG